MSTNRLINDSILTDIAGAIREKNGLTNPYHPQDMAAAIHGIDFGFLNVKIPEGYERLSYIEGTGTQYIELPSYFDRNDEIILMCSVNEQGTDKYVLAPSTWNDDGRNRFALGTHSYANPNVPTMAFGSTTTGSTYLFPGVPLAIYNDILLFVYRDNVCVEHIHKRRRNLSSISFSKHTTNLRLLYGYLKATSGRIFFYQHNRNGVTLERMVPVKRLSDEEVGMYDVANDVFYTNDGTDTFEYE